MGEGIGDEVGTAGQQEGPLEVNGGHFPVSPVIMAVGFYPAMFSCQEAGME